MTNAATGILNGDAPIITDGYSHIIEAAVIAMGQGYDPNSYAMVGAIRAAVPGVGQDEIKAALRWWCK